jgi:hypothetical protein
MKHLTVTKITATEALKYGGPILVGWWAKRRYEKQAAYQFKQDMAKIVIDGLVTIGMVVVPPLVTSAISARFAAKTVQE